MKKILILSLTIFVLNGCNETKEKKRIQSDKFIQDLIKAGKNTDNNIVQKLSSKKEEK